MSGRLKRAVRKDEIQKMQERLQKIIARAGIASRRHAEQLILSGQVRVNGRVVTELGTKADAGKDRIEAAGRGGDNGRSGGAQDAEELFAGPARTCLSRGAAGLCGVGAGVFDK